MDASLFSEQLCSVIGVLVVFPKRTLVNAYVIPFHHIMKNCGLPRVAKLCPIVATFHNLSLVKTLNISFISNFPFSKASFKLYLDLASRHIRTFLNFRFKSTMESSGITIYYGE